MTNRDPLRSLDSVEPPDAWDDIVDRAAGPHDLGSGVGLHPEPKRRWPLVAATILVLCVAVGAVFAFGRGDDGSGVATAPDGGGAVAMWGKRWALESLVVDGETRRVVSGMEGGPVVLDATEPPSVGVHGCNAMGGEMVLDGDRLSAVDGFWSQLAGCIGGDGEALMEQDSILQGLLSGPSTVSVTGDTLTIEGGGVTARWLVEGSDPAPAVDPGPRFWNRTWTIDLLVDDGAERTIIQPPEGSLDGSILRFRTSTEGFPTLTTAGVPVAWDAEGSVGVNGCNGAGGPAHLDGDVLVADPGGFDDRTGEALDGGWVSTLVGCVDEDLMAQDEWLSALLEGGPTVTVSGDRLVVALGEDRLEGHLAGVGAPIDGGAGSSAPGTEAAPGGGSPGGGSPDGTVGGPTDSVPVGGS